MELEFSVDPLFKKASADFDEGGARGLLLNHLSIDFNGRIVFDSSDDIEYATTKSDSARRKNDDVAANDGNDESGPEVEDKIGQGRSGVADIDISALGAKFFPDMARLDEQHICPSLKNFNFGDNAGSMDTPILKAPEDWRQEKENFQSGGLGDQTGVFLDGDNVAGFDEDEGSLEGFNVDTDGGFGGGGEAWARLAAKESRLHIQTAGSNDEEGEYQAEGLVVGDFDPVNNQYAPTLQHKGDEAGHEDILSYFDNALQKNWAGPEHWQIRRIKDINKAAAPAISKRKEKEPFEIDFNVPLDPSLAELIYTPATSNATISMPKAQWKTKTRNLLPDDKHFNSRQLLRLFLKPKARVGSKINGLGTLNRPKAREISDGEIDEALWPPTENPAHRDSTDNQVRQGNYDANFFQDDRVGFPDSPPDVEGEFADAQEAFSPGETADPGFRIGSIDGVSAAGQERQEIAFGTQLVTQSRRLRPEYVQYARVAKKVDVRRLKEEIWRGIGFENVRIILGMAFL